jgi:hypothetical protein
VQVGPFRREELRREFRPCEDGGQLVHTFFRLWYDPAAVREPFRTQDPLVGTRSNEGPSASAESRYVRGSTPDGNWETGGDGSARGTQGGTGSLSGDHCRTSFVDEDWCLRMVRPSEFRALVREAGLRIVAEYSSFSDGLAQLQKESFDQEGGVLTGQAAAGTGGGWSLTAGVEGESGRPPLGDGARVFVLGLL